MFLNLLVFFKHIKKAKPLRLALTIQRVVILLKHDYTINLQSIMSLITLTRSFYPKNNYFGSLQ